VEIEQRSVSALTPYARNARTHDAAQIAQIAASITEFGFTNPVLVDKKGGIIAGHGRVLAAQELGLEQVPVIVLGHLTAAQRRAYVIADNRLALNAGWDEDLLRSEIEALGAADFDIGVIGFSDDELAEILADRTEGLTDADDAPEPPANPVSALGDMWLLGEHRLLCGDCTDPGTVAVVLAGEKPHLMVTDPPYGVNYDPKWRDRELETWTAPRATGAVHGDERSDWRDAWVLFPGDVAYCWSPPGSNMVDHQLALVAAGLEIRMQVIWAKSHFPIGRGNYHVQHEPCLYAVRKGRTAHWQGARDQSTLWQIDNASAFKGSRGVGDESTGHSTQKPIECMKRPIENNSKVGEAVYDPFVGSFTTGIACEMTGRRCVAIELSPVYVDVGVLRWQAFTGQEARHAETGETFAEVEAKRHVLEAAE
jgi:DNA modification methylase